MSSAASSAPGVPSGPIVRGTDGSGPARQLARLPCPSPRSRPSRCPSCSSTRPGYCQNVPRDGELPRDRDARRSPAARRSSSSATTREPWRSWRTGRTSRSGSPSTAWTASILRLEESIGGRVTRDAVVTSYQPDAAAPAGHVRLHVPVGHDLHLLGRSRGIVSQRHRPPARRPIREEPREPRARGRRRRQARQQRRAGTRRRPKRIAALAAKLAEPSRTTRTRPAERERRPGRSRAAAHRDRRGRRRQRDQGRRRGPRHRRAALGRATACPTPQPSAPAAVIASIARMVKKIAAEVELDPTCPVGVGFPAVVIDGVTKSAANVDPGWVDFDADTALERVLGRPVHLVNDADAAGVAEMRFGAGVGQQGHGVPHHARDRDRLRAVLQRDARAQPRAGAHGDPRPRRRAPLRRGRAPQARRSAGRPGRRTSTSTCSRSRSCSARGCSSSAAASPSGPSGSSRA